MAELPFYKMWAGDFLQSQNVRLMRLCEVGLYVLVLNVAWLGDGLPEDAEQIRRLAGIDAEEFSDAWPAIEKLFPVASDGRRRNQRQEAERVDAAQRRQQKVDAANTRWQRQQDANAYANADGTHMQSESELEPELEPESEIKRENISCPSVDGRVDDSFSLSPDAPTPATTKQKLADQQEAWFSIWWPQYWRREQRAAALKAFRRVVKTQARFNEVLAATEAQAPAMLAREGRFRPLGATWLSGERWNDDPAELSQSDRAGVTAAAFDRLINKETQKKET